MKFNNKTSLETKPLLQNHNVRDKISEILQIKNKTPKTKPITQNKTNASN